MVSRSTVGRIRKRYPEGVWILHCMKKPVVVLHPKIYGKIEAQLTCHAYVSEGK